MNFRHFIVVQQKSQKTTLTLLNFNQLFAHFLDILLANYNNQRFL